MFEKRNCSRSLAGRVAAAASVVALMLVPYVAKAQTAANTSDPSSIGTSDTGSGHDYSSSAEGNSYLSADGSNGDGLAAAPSASPQYGQSSNHRYPESTSRWSHVALEAGAGFTAPIGNDAPYDTWGYNLTFGGGWNFTKRLGALVEYQFNRNKIPGSTLAAVGAPGGNINTWSFTVDPIYYYAQGKKVGGYVTGGGGFYRKVTNFTAPEEEEFCSFFCEIGTVNVTIGHFSSNQGGLNIGTGVYWKAFGEDSNAKLYAEARYVWVDSPAATATVNGEGSEGLIPVTFGIRF